MKIQQSLWCIWSGMHRNEKLLSKIKHLDESRYCFFAFVLWWGILGRRTAFNWLTGSSVDTLGEYTQSSDTSSSLLGFGKKTERHSAAWRQTGEGFGTKQLSAPSDEGNSRSKGQSLFLSVGISCYGVATWITASYESLSLAWSSIQSCSWDS